MTPFPSLGAANHGKTWFRRAAGERSLPATSAFQQSAITRRPDGNAAHRAAVGAVGRAAQAAADRLRQRYQRRRGWPQQ
jgi:hypothetical protein